MLRWRDVGARGSGVRSDGRGVPAEGAGMMSEGILWMISVMSFGLDGRSTRWRCQGKKQSVFSWSNVSMNGKLRNERSVVGTEVVTSSSRGSSQKGKVAAKLCERTGRHDRHQRRHCVCAVQRYTRWRLLLCERFGRRS